MVSERFAPVASNPSDIDMMSTFYCLTANDMGEANADFPEPAGPLSSRRLRPVSTSHDSY